MLPRSSQRVVEKNANQFELECKNLCKNVENENFSCHDNLRRGHFVSFVCFVDRHVTVTGPARAYQVLVSLQLLQHLQVLYIKSNKKPSKL